MENLINKIRKFNSDSKINEYKVICPVCFGDENIVNCHACGGNGYNILTFKNGKRLT